MGIGKKMCKYKSVISQFIYPGKSHTTIYCLNPDNPISNKCGIVTSNECSRKSCKYYISKDN